MPPQGGDKAKGVIDKVTDALGGMYKKILELPDAVRPFVDAFSNAGDRLDAAYKSLYSTIGYALEPIIIAASATVERFADAISSGMNLLRGPIEKVSGLFMGVLRPIMARVAYVFESVGRVIEAFTPLLEPVAAVLEATLTLWHLFFTAVGELVMGLIEQLIPSGKTLTSITDEITATFVELAAVSLRLIDYFLAMIGQEDRMLAILEGIIKSAERGGRRQGKPEGYGISGVEDVYRKRLLAAAGAGGRSAQEESRDYLKELVNLAREMKDDIKNRPEEREAKREKAKDDTLDAIKAAIRATFEPILSGWQSRDREKDRNTP